MPDTAAYGKYKQPHHRIRLTDEELDMIVSALRQNAAGNISEARKGKIKTLVARLVEREPGEH